MMRPPPPGRRIVTHVCAKCGARDATYEGRLPRRWRYVEGKLLCGGRYTDDCASKAERKIARVVR